MDWIVPFYTTKSDWYGPSGVLPHHRERAEAIERLSGAGAAKRVLELGAGAGGAAAATADLGHAVIALELTPLRARYARELAATPRAGTLTVLEADFCTVALDGQFDVVCCWDGFGMGSDADQRRLLRRIAREWLAPGGCALLDIYSPFPWARLAGQHEAVESVHAVQRNDFDPLGCRFVDEWWPEDDESQKMAQSIRCYTPADLLLLIEGTGLTLDDIEVEGQPVAMGAAHTMASPLWEAESYLVKLVAVPS
ncbi:MAG: class I SAM-dependent methyltransferase [Ktedonobacterales bacterium]